MSTISFTMTYAYTITSISYSNVFRYVANGLDVYRSSAPNIEQNTFALSTLPGLNGALVYDIQKG